MDIKNFGVSDSNPLGKRETWALIVAGLIGGLQQAKIIDPAWDATALAVQVVGLFFAAITIVAKLFAKGRAPFVGAILACTLLGAGGAQAAGLYSGGLSAGPAIIQRDAGSSAAFVPQVWAGRSMSDLVTAAATLDLEISGSRPAYLAAVGGRLNLERSAKFRLAAGVEATRAFGPGADEALEGSSWRALFVGSYIARRGGDGRPSWSFDYRPTLDFNNGKATHRVAAKWHAL